jgi:hypothetical protein
MPKRIVNIRLRPDQEDRINAIVERSAILDTSKFVRIAVDWLLRSDIGEVIKTIIDEEGSFPDYAMPKKPGKKRRRRKPSWKALRPGLEKPATITRPNGKGASDEQGIRSRLSKFLQPHD